MRLVTAKLKARATSDGLVEMKDEISLGNEYQIDLDSIREMELFNVIHGVFHTKVWVTVVRSDSNEPDGLIPVELLDFPKD